MLWTSCAVWGAQPSTANAAGERRGRIVVLGDSLTAGYGVDPSEAYPAILQKKVDRAGLPYEVVNAGISGDTTSGGLRRLEWALRAGADVLVVALGGNDGLRGVPPKQTAANLQAIIEQARTKSPSLQVILTGMQMPPNMGRSFVEEFAAIFPRVARATGAKLVPFLLEGVGGVARLNQPDLIHPTAEGQQRIAENVWPVLESVLREQAKQGS